ncbi:hypothetical protein ACFX1T_013128 [Malus domestica]
MIGTNLGLTRRILDTLFQAKTRQKLGLQLYTGMEDPIEHLNLFESTMAYQMHTDEKRCLLFPSTLSGRALNCHEYSRCAEADDKIALKAFTAGLRDCFFKYMINANT